MTINDRIGRKLKNMQNRLYDTRIKISGVSCNTVLLNISIDKYKNTEIIIDNYYDLECMLDFPNDEIPTSLTNTQDNQGSSVLHMYDLLPISCFIKHKDVVDKHIKIGSVILYRIMNFDDTYQVIPFQILDVVGKGNPSSAIIWNQFTVAPTVSYQLDNEEYYQQIYEYYQEHGNLNGFKIEDIEEEIPNKDNNENDVENEESSDEDISDKKIDNSQENEELDDEIQYDRYGNPIN